MEQFDKSKTVIKFFDKDNSIIAKTEIYGQGDVALETMAKLCDDIGGHHFDYDKYLSAETPQGDNGKRPTYYPTHWMIP